MGTGLSRGRERSAAPGQSTRAQALACALTDPPVGVLAWNLEWFVDYAPERGVQPPVDRDVVLTDVSLYWFTRTSGSAAHMYKDGGDAFHGGRDSGVPTAVTPFPGDAPVRTLAERSNSIVHRTR